MEAIVGLAFDDPEVLRPNRIRGGTHYLGPRRLLQLLEVYLGFQEPLEEIDYLRVEQYRQLLFEYVDSHPDTFFRAAFEADGPATAADLLERRDNLVASGWSFKLQDDMPPRLRCLAELEQVLRQEDETSLLQRGWADRLQRVLQALSYRSQPLQRIVLHEPIALLPPGLQRLLEALRQQGVVIATLARPVLGEGATDLDRFKAATQGGPRSASLRGDGSLLILRARRETHLAAYLAALLRQNAGWQPSCLLPGKNRTLDNALALEGLPSIGVPSASLARPTLQVLKLVTAFLWEPVDVQRIMEFVSLAVKPLPDDLADTMAAVLAQTPGLFSDRWIAVVRSYLESRPPKEAEEARFQYDFWFSAPRYNAHETAPKERVRALFAYLQSWGRQRFEENGGLNSSLLILSNQARRAVELIDTLPEQELDFLRVERIVRTVYEPAPVAYQAAEVGSMQAVYQPASVHADLDELIWWDFVANDPDYFFSRWYPGEITFLQQQSVELDGPDRQNRRLTWQRQRPLLHTQKRLLLCLPDSVDGVDTTSHPLFGDLQAAFTNLGSLILDIDKETIPAAWKQHFKLPVFQTIETQPLGHPRPFFQLPVLHEQAPRVETFSSLEDLIYYPYQWVFRHQIRLQKSSILSVVSDRVLFGNLAHRFIERLMDDWSDSWQQQDVYHWIDRHSYDILRKEGAPLLLYGREPERIAFLERLKYGAWSLVHHLQRNGWTDPQTEVDCEGAFGDLSVKGRADLIARRGNECVVIDLKYRGGRRYRELIKNQEDLQLILYAQLIGDGVPAHSAYYSIERADMIARNSAAFEQIDAIAPDADHLTVHRDILDRLQATYAWRLQQLRAGTVEIRCAQTAEELEETYGSQLLDLLEMRQEDAPFDDYRALIERLM